MRMAVGVLEIVEARPLSGHRIRAAFNDGTVRILDFGPFLQKSVHPDLVKYRQPRRFRAFRLHEGNIMWGDYEMLFPIADLHAGRI